MTISTKLLEQKLDDQNDHIKEIHKELKVMNETLIVNTQQLTIHIQGVNEARRQNDMYRQDMDDRLKPIEEANILARGYVKAFMFFIGMPAATYYLVQIYKFVSNQ